MRTYASALLVVMALPLSACDRGDTSDGGAAPWNEASSRPKSVPVASASPPVVAQDPSRRVMSAYDRLQDVAPDFRAEVAKAAACKLAETGLPVSSGMVAHLEATVRLNGGKAPPCAVRNFATGYRGSEPPRSAP